MWASFYVSKENNIHPYATLVYKFNNSTYSGLIVEIVALHHSKPRCDCFEHDQNNRAYGTIFKYSYTFARHSHCTRTNIRNKSFKFVRKSQNFTVLTMLRISYGLPRVFYEFLRFFSRVFRIVLRVNGHVVRFDANTIRIHATGCKCSTGGLRVNYELVRKYETD